MFPKEIIEIFQKYQDNNESTLIDTFLSILIPTGSSTCLHNCFISARQSPYYSK